MIIKDELREIRWQTLIVLLCFTLVVAFWLKSPLLEATREQSRQIAIYVLCDKFLTEEETKAIMLKYNLIEADILLPDLLEIGK